MMTARKRLSDPHPAFSYIKVFISDTHLGSGKTATSYLYEFLSNLDFDKLEDLYIAGDFIDGWEHVSRKQQPLPEMERRIMDVINYAAAHGVNIHFIPGNHDEDLRPLIDTLNNRKSNRSFHKNIRFARHEYYHTAPDENSDSKTIKIIHGDEFDAGGFFKKWLKPIAKVSKASYDTIVKLSSRASNFCYEKFGVHIFPIKRVKSVFKKAFNKAFPFKPILKSIEHENVDGIFMGHSHLVGTQVFQNKDGKNVYIINDGDWVESATAAYVDDAREIPKILDYKKERERRGFGALPHIRDTHPAKFAQFRRQTNRQVRLIHHLWPAKNRKSYLTRHKKTTKALHSELKNSATLRDLMHDLDRGTYTDKTQAQLTQTFQDLSERRYITRDKGLRSIFNTHAKGDDLTQDDIIYLKTVVRELGIQNERKITELKEDLSEIKHALDIPSHRRQSCTP